MIGNQYWSTGIRVKYDGRNWVASLKFYDNGFCEDESTEGKLQCRYRLSDVMQMVVTLKQDAEKLGIKFERLSSSGLPPCLYVKDSEKWPLLKNWEAILQPVADAIGFKLQADF